MEALTAIDVNTGKYVGKMSSEETILKTNLEAVREIVRQLRLRNIGGIIVIDFIDMAKAANREKVYNALKAALKEDKARTNILKISELGIVEMTRKRVRESIAQSLCEPCPYCEGNGIVKAKDTVVMEIYRELMGVLPMRRRKAVLYVNPTIAARLVGEDGIIKDLRERFKKKDKARGRLPPGRVRDSIILRRLLKIVIENY
jgi:ribonuclease G